MSLSWSTDQVARILGLPRPSLSLPISQITTDSRQVQPGALFVAIAGDSFDGHTFIPEAIAKGAIAVLSERPGAHETGAFFQVPSTLNAIRSLAHTYRKSFNIPLIAVVGAVGKTTTKELISSILHGKFKSILKTEGSQNGFLGIPLTLLNLKPGTEIGVIEIGIDEIGAMEQHLNLVDPTHLILTRTGPEHLHQLKTVEIAADEELKAFDFAIQHHRPIAINLSDPFVLAWFKKNQARLKGLAHPTYSLNASDKPDYLGTFNAESRVLTLKGNSGSKSFLCPLPGEHHAHNLLASIVVSRFFGLSDPEIEKGIATFKTAYGLALHQLHERVGETNAR
jgi:UDP-N-acetylmuramoyl-tripeptide--D-alanyl-D-alanine ligase